jgi:mannosyltransferase
MKPTPTILESGIAVTKMKDVGKLRALAVLAVCLLVALAESINLGQRSLWYDEAYSAAWTHLGWTTLWPQIHAKELFLLTYYALLKLWETFGQSEVALRAFSVFFSVATLPFVYWLGRRCFNPATGFVAMILLAANPVFYYYAREARASSLLIFFSVAASAAFLHALDARTTRAWALYVLVSAFGIYCQLFLMFILCAHALFTLVNWRTIPYRAVCGSFLIVAALVAPLFLLSFTAGMTLHSWIPRPTIGNLFASLFDVTGGSIAFLLDAIIFAVVFAVWQTRGWHSPQRFVQFLLLWLFVPIVIVFAISLLHPIYDSRYLVGVIPAGSLLIANAVTRLPKWCWFLVALMLAASLRGLILQKNGDVQDWRQAVGTILSEARPGDAVVVYPSTGFVAYEYYARSAPQPRGVPIATIFHVVDGTSRRLDRIRTAQL